MIIYASNQYFYIFSYSMFLLLIISDGLSFGFPSNQD